MSMNQVWLRMMGRWSMAIGITALVLGQGAISVKAEVPYETYSYNYWGEEVKEPHSYLYTQTLAKNEMGTALNSPSDLVVGSSSLYIADTGNSRIVVTDLQGNFLYEIKSAASQSDLLKEPQGLFVTEEGHIYVADTGNSRIVEYDTQGTFIREIGRPKTSLILDSQEYSPTKVVVDKAGRIYVVAYGINMGLVEFNNEGEFQGFMGSTEVSVSAFTYIWKNYFSTEAQQERMETIVPTEYSNIFVDDENFIYATINNLSYEDRQEGADAIRRLNPTGTDVLRRLGDYEIIGDLPSASNYNFVYSSFVDVAATDYGCYFLLDAANGKIFAYDYDGISLFAFGRNGIKKGNFQKPVAIGVSEEEEQIYVLDSVLNSVLVFDLTEYGDHLLNAIKQNDKGDAAGSTQEWKEVLKQNSNSELAYVGLGKNYLSEKNYKKAMECFKLGNNKKYYNKAFTYYRKELMEQYLTKVVVGITLLLAGIWLVRKILNWKRWVGEVRCFMERH